MIASILFQCLNETDDATLEKDAKVQMEIDRDTRHSKLMYPKSLNNLGRLFIPSNKDIKIRENDFARAGARTLDR